jgi:hypothetical protein
MAQATHQASTYTTAQAEALFLEQLKRTNPTAPVREVIVELERAKRRHKSTKSNGKGNRRRAQKRPAKAS